MMICRNNKGLRRGQRQGVSRNRAPGLAIVLPVLALFLLTQGTLLPGPAKAQRAEPASQADEQPQADEQSQADERNLDDEAANDDEAAGDEPFQDAPQAGGAPVSLFGKPEAEEETSPSTEELRALPGSEAGGVREGELDIVGGVAVGLLNSGQTGLDLDMWNGSSGRQVAKAVEALPTGMMSPTRQTLFRHLLLTSAYDPPGDIKPAFLTVRAERVYEAGLLEEAEALMELRQTRSVDLATLKLETRLHLMRQNNRQACANAARTRDEITDMFWQRLRTLCYVLVKDRPAAQLNADLLSEQGLDDPLFYFLVANLLDDAGLPLDLTQVTDEVHAAFLDLASKELALDVLRTVKPALQHMAVRAHWADEEPGNLLARRIPMTEDLVTHGRLPVARLERLYQNIELSTAEEASLLEPGQEGHPKRAAAIYLALQKAIQPIERAKLLALAWQDARKNRTQELFARLYGAHVRIIDPTPVLDIFALDFAEVSFISGNYEEARGWMDLAAAIPSAPPEDAVRLANMQIAYDLVTSTRPGAAPKWDARERLITAKNEDWLDRAVKEVRLHMALGGWIEDDLRTMVLQAPQSNEEGLPPPGTLSRLDAAARAGRKAEVLLYTLHALGDSNSAQIPMSVLEKSVQSLARAGFSNNAKTLVIESLFADL